jgi:hypothetical protein
LHHANILQAGLEAADAEGKARREAAGIQIAGAIPGIYVSFESFPGIDLAFESLDPQQGKIHPQLRSIREVVVDGTVVEQATVFIPDGTLGYFLKRIEEYHETANSDKPRHRNLLDRVRSIGIASLEKLWTDAPTEFPGGDDPVWWEVWLRSAGGDEALRFRAFAEHQNLLVGSQTLAFTDRTVLLVHATRTQLATALDVLDDVAELRLPRPSAEFIAMEWAADQVPWVDDVVERMHVAPDDSPAACIVDSGVDQGHALIAPSLLVDDCHACEPGWGTDDHLGHGTEMAGLALFGDLNKVVQSTGPVHLRHRLESVKFLPPAGANAPELHGAITATAASLVEISAPQRKRVFAIATTTQGATADGTRTINVGQPSSWSAAIDALAAGLSIETTEDGLIFLNEEQAADGRIFLISAGNVNEFEDEYLDRCDLEPIEDPAQAWNALTVGAYTELIAIDPGEVGYDGWAPLAPHGELSPYSRTSVACSSVWPVKPDVLLEGGNVARSPEGAYDWPYSFQRLTTKRRYPDPRPLTVTRQTSAATAQAAHHAASIMAEYPSAWPETIRALIVHSAEWTPAMVAKLNAAKQRKPRDALHRRYGMGVADLTRATRSATDALTLIAENVIHPFDGQGRMREIHFHALPWPADVLGELGEAQTRLRVTLSYFIEPNPGSRGWVRRYSYASHGLRFDVRRPTESNDDFRKRLNQLALAEEEKRPVPAASDAAEWYFGPDYRVSGSIHSDIWQGNAADLAARGAIAVYPVTGWWKELKARDRSDRGARYSLIVSIETPGQDVDIWTEVANQIGIPVEIGG